LGRAEGRRRLDGCFVDLAPIDAAVRGDRLGSPDKLCQIPHRLAHGKLLSGLRPEGDTKEREAQAAVPVAKFVDDSERESADERKAGTPGEGNAIDGEVFGCLEAHTARPRLQPHLAGLPDTDSRRDRSVGRERAGNVAPNEFR
jgi:hypothetical protein